MRRLAIAVALLLGFAAPAWSQSIPALVDLPASAAASDPGLAGRRAALLQERATLRDQVKALNTRCLSVEVGSAAETSCNDDKASLVSALKIHVGATNDFNAAAPAATPPAASPARPALDAGSLQLINSIEAVARRRGWGAEKIANLDRALRTLDFAGRNASREEIRRSWRDILAHDQDPDLAREAAQGGGLGFAGAGAQTRYNDCTVFALANAAGLPYGVVAARATELIGEGDWRSAQQRTHPQATIETGGLNGGEVVMMAETFGHAQVVQTANFTDVLAQGRPILVAVNPPNGDGRMGHEVLITKTFRHAGETWYVVMDSNQGPMRRLYMSQGELDTVLKENGVAYRPDRHTTPRLLGTGAP